MKEIAGLLHYDRIGLHALRHGFSIDPSRRSAVALVSHAHGDHAISGHDTVYTTRPTWELMNQRYGSTLKSSFKEVQFTQPFHMGDVTVTFFPAGHMLGSAQILMEYDGKRYLYTGDFKVQPDPTCEPYHPVPCDYLITESTFAFPEHLHPNPSAAIQELAAEPLPLIIGAYALGKAQRITRLIHDTAPYRTIHVHPQIVPFHRTYEEMGVSLGDWLPYSRTAFMRDYQAVLILPPSVFRRFERMSHGLKVFATGWKQSYYRCDRVLSVSDHADWNDLIRVIQESGASTIFTLHGDGSHLKSHLEPLGHRVELLPA